MPTLEIWFSKVHMRNATLSLPSMDLYWMISVLALTAEPTSSVMVNCLLIVTSTFILLFTVVHEPWVKPKSTLLCTSYVTCLACSVAVMSGSKFTIKDSSSCITIPTSLTKSIHAHCTLNCLATPFLEAMAASSSTAPMSEAERQLADAQLPVPPPKKTKGNTKPPPQPGDEENKVRARQEALAMYSSVLKAKEQVLGQEAGFSWEARVCGLCSGPIDGPAKWAMPKAEVYCCEQCYDLVVVPAKKAQSEDSDSSDDLLAPGVKPCLTCGRPAQQRTDFCSSSCAALKGRPDDGPLVTGRSQSVPAKPEPEIISRDPEPLERVDIEGTINVMRVNYGGTKGMVKGVQVPPPAESRTLSRSERRKQADWQASQPEVLYQYPVRLQSWKTAEEAKEAKEGSADIEMVPREVATTPLDSMFLPGPSGIERVKLRPRMDSDPGDLSSAFFFEDPALPLAVSERSLHLVERCTKDEIEGLLAPLISERPDPWSLHQLLVAYLERKKFLAWSHAIRLPKLKKAPKSGGGAGIGIQNAFTDRWRYKDHKRLCARCKAPWVGSAKECYTCKVSGYTSTTYISGQATPIHVRSDDASWELLVTEKGPTWASLEDGWVDAAAPDGAPGSSTTAAAASEGSARGDHSSDGQYRDDYGRPDKTKDRGLADAAVKARTSVNVSKMAVKPPSAAYCSQPSAVDHISDKSRLTIRNLDVNDEPLAKWIAENEKDSEVPVEPSMGFNPMLLKAEKATKAFGKFQSALETLSKTDREKLAQSTADIVNLRMGAQTADLAVPSILDDHAKQRLQQVLSKIRDSQLASWIQTAGILDLDDDTVEALTQGLEKRESDLALQAAGHIEKRFYECSWSRLNPAEAMELLGDNSLSDKVQKYLTTPEAWNDPDPEMFRGSHKADVAAKSDLRKLGQCPWPEAFFSEMPPHKYVLTDLAKDPAVCKETLKAMETALSGLNPSTPAFKKVYLSHLLQVHAGSLRQFAGRWVYTTGPCPADEAAVHSDIDLAALESRTWPFSGSWIPWTSRTWEPYPDDQLAKQRRNGLRPELEDIRQLMWAVGRTSSGEPTDEWHWVRKSETHSLSTLFSLWSNRFTCKELYLIWLSMPLQREDHQRGRQQGMTAKDHRDVLAKWDDLVSYMTELGVGMPADGTERTIVMRCLGALFAKKQFTAFAPESVLHLPSVPGADDYEAQYYKAVCDERIHPPPIPLLQALQSVEGAGDVFSLDTPMLSAWQQWRCNAVVHFAAMVTNPKELLDILGRLQYPESHPAVLAVKEAISNGDLAIMELPKGWNLDTAEEEVADALGGSARGDHTPGADVDMGDKEQPPPPDGGLLERPGATCDDGYPAPCPEMVTCASSKKWRCSHGFSSWAPVFWFHMTCGMVLSSVLPWEIKKGFHCKWCTGKWKAGKGGTRQVTIQDDNKALSLVMHEPPGKPYHRFLKNRALLYTKLVDEASAPPRDVAIMGVQKRIFLSEAASDAIWHMLFNEDSSGLKHMDDIAKKAIQKDFEAQQQAAASSDTPGMSSSASYSEVQAVTTTPSC